MNLQGIMLSKKRQPQKVIHNMIPILKYLNFKISAFQVSGTGGGGHGYKRTGEESFGDGTILDLDCGGGCTNLHMRQKCMELNTPPPPKHTHTYTHTQHILFQS